MQIHGGDVYRHPGVIDFSSNVYPEGTPEQIKKALKEAAEQVFQYPDIVQEQLLKRLSEYEKRDSRQIVLGNGAAELIFACVQALRPKKAMLVVPTFSEYEIALNSVNCEIVYYHLSDDFRLTNHILSSLTEDLDLVFLCNPNNPTGIPIDSDLLQQIGDVCREKHIFIVIDECFQEFLETKHQFDFKSVMTEEDRVIIIKSFTKLFAIPGVRLGYLTASRFDICKRIRKLIQPWNLSVFAQVAGITALDIIEEQKEKILWIHEERSYVKMELEKLGYRVWNSKANYLFFYSERPLYEKALKAGFLIRDCSNYNGLQSGYYRIVIRRREENERLLEWLRQL